MSTGSFGFGDSGVGMTMAFITMSMAETFHSFNMRTVRRSVFTLKKQNGFLLGSIALSFALTFAVVFIPGLNTAFGFVPVTVTQYLIAVGIALLVLPVVEFVKWIERRFFGHKRHPQAGLEKHAKMTK
jgi:Ca2+-transporting ATPase